jgi:molybdopterin-guanine dinucleotide biosynthesis protein A
MGISRSLDKSAVVLAGGFSGRLGQDKGLLLLAGKPLVSHVLDAVGSVVDERIVVVSSGVQAEAYVKVVGSGVRVLVDACGVRSPLVGALTGFEGARGECAVLLPCDTPLVSKGVVLFLFELCAGRSAVVPRWPNGYLEPLQAVYRRKPALEAAREALAGGGLRVRCVVDGLRGVRYVSTLVLEGLDPGLRTFFNVNTLLDLRRAEKMLRRG